MINARRLLVSVLGAVLMAVPLARSQDAPSPESKLIATQPPVIQVLGLEPQRLVNSWAPLIPISVPVVGGMDLSRYRNFQFGETLPALAKQAGLDLSEVKLIHERPAVIQELEWPVWIGAGSAAQTDPVRTVLFSFYNGELFRIVISYDQQETEGLTTSDMIEAISAKYGIATRLATTKIVSPPTQVDYEGETLIARWEDSQYSFNLYRSPFQLTYEMTAFSKKVDALARVAAAESNRLDAQTAPQREIQLQQAEDEKNRESLEKDRQANKSNFRP
jgi:hypothetical protein